MSTAIIPALMIAIVALTVVLFLSRRRIRVLSLTHEQSERRFAEVFDSAVDLLRSRKAQEVFLRRFELLASSVHDAILFLARDGAIVDVNNATIGTFGLDAGDLRGVRLGDLCATADAVEIVARALREPSAVPFEIQCVRRGEPFFAEITLLDCTDEEAMLIAIVRDVSAQRHREATQSLLRAIDQRILQNEPLNSILEFITSNIADTYGFPVVQIGLKSKDGSVDICNWSGSESGFLEQINVRWDDSPEGRGPTGTAIRTGMMQHRDIRFDPEFAEWRDKAIWHGLQRAVALPLAAYGTTLGALTLFRYDVEPFTDADIAQLRILADQVAISLVAAEDREQLRLQTVALESAANAVLVTDSCGTIRWVNPAFTRLTGYTLEESLGHTPNLLDSGVQNHDFYDQMWSSILAGQVWKGEIHNRRKDGTVYLEQQVITPVVQSDGRISHFVAIKEDITERKRQEEQIRYLALHDPLTGVPNRRALERQLERVSHRVSSRASAALVMFDVDHFKMCNDTLGHGAGDQILTELGCLARDCLRPGDFLARLGGDEFCALCYEVTTETTAAIAERIRATVHDHYFCVNGTRVDLTLSVGFASVAAPNDVETVLTRADAALYKSKRDGRNRVTDWASCSEQEDSSAASHWVTRIRTALRSDELVLHYQPVMHLATGKIVHYEALLRMRGDDARLIQPAEFLPIAERFGLMPQLDRWVFDTVIDVLRCCDHVSLFVNLSASTLGDRTLLEYFERRIRDERVEAGRLAFEITETAAITDFHTAQRWIHTLREAGCRFALDDFGVGFSSLSYLRALPVDFIKIDKSFVCDLDVSPTSRVLVDAIGRVADNLGKTVIAEGVESEIHRTILRELSIEYGQGFLWGQPHEGSFANDAASTLLEQI